MLSALVSWALLSLVLSVSTESVSAAPTFSVWRVITRGACLFIWLIPIMIALVVPDVVQNSDFLMTFYAAGRLVLEGKANHLYPGPEASSLITTYFNSYVHQLLDKLPAAKTAVYMYPPLTAYLFQPLGGLLPQTALIVWQIISIAAYWFCVKLFVSVDGKRHPQYFWLSILYFPVLQTLLIGHLGIVLGLLPLMLGYWLLMKGHPNLAGITWSLLLLKPQFFPVALLVAGAFALNRRFNVAAFLLVGTVVLVLGTIFCLGPEVSYNWIASLKLSDTIFSDPRYGYPTYLVSSVPGALVQVLPFSMRSYAKLVLYALAAIVSLHALFISRRIMSKDKEDHRPGVQLVFLIGLFVLPMVLPHFLFYDLCVLALGGMLIYSSEDLRSNRQLMRDLLLAWLLADAYIPMAAFQPMQPILPFLLLFALTVLYVRILLASRRLVSSSSAT